MRSFATDYATGTQAEKHLLPIFNRFFNTTFAPTTRYDSFDFTSPVYNLELKTRTNSKSKYPTTMIPASKLSKLSKKTIFAFNFTDGLYYIEYDQTLFKTFTTNEFQRADRQDHRDRKQAYLYIPVKHLLPINPNAKPVDSILKTLQRGQADVVYPEEGNGDVRCSQADSPPQGAVPSG